MRAVLKKELGLLFGTWTGWALLGILSAVLGLVLFYFRSSYNIFNAGVSTLQPFFLLMPFVLVPLCSVLGMRTFAAERETGAYSVMLSLPVSFRSLILGRILAVFLSGILILLPLLVYVFLIGHLMPADHTLDAAALIVSVFGLLLLLATFSAIAVLASALARTQLMAFLLSLGISGLLYFGIQQLVDFNLVGSADYFVGQLGMAPHYGGFSYGVVSLSDVSYFLALILGSVAATEYVLSRNLKG